MPAHASDTVGIHRRPGDNLFAEHRSQPAFTRRQKDKGTNMPKLGGKVAVITGATSGMALATAKLFVAEGAYVYITGRDRNRLDEAVAAIGHNVTGVQADSASLNDLARLAETVREHHGRVDVLFASAGLGSVSDPLGTITPETFDAMVGVNFRGTLFTVQYLLPLMSDGASIILNGTTSTNMPNQANAGASAAHSCCRTAPPARRDQYAATAPTGNCRISQGSK